MSASDFVVLRGGLTLPVDAVRLALDLERRGLHLGVDGDFLSIGPRNLLTDADRDRIRRWKRQLLAIVWLSSDDALGVLHFPHGRRHALVRARPHDPERAATPGFKLWELRHGGRVLACEL